MAIELTTADSNTIESIRESLSAADSTSYTKDEFGGLTVSNAELNNGSDIVLDAADDVRIFGKDKTTSDSEGGDIRIECGDGGNADAGDSGGSGGDVSIIAGQGGNPSEQYQGGPGGNISITAGNGAYGSVEFDQFAQTGGDITLRAGDAGYSDGDPTKGSLGGEVYIQAGDSTVSNNNGGSVYIRPGSNSTFKSGNVEIQIPPSSPHPSYNWIFQNDGKLILPDNSSQIVVEEDLGVRIGNGNVNTAPSSHIKVGGDEAFQIFGGPPGYSYKFDKNHTLTLPPSGTLSADGGDFNSGYLQFIGGASGDGYGYSTIELHPDSTRSSADQYIIIDPTSGEPPHIHIRAGGQQDSSGAVLFLGGENSHVKVGAGANPPITIASNNNNFIFNTDGSLIFPDGGALRYRNSVPASSVGAPGDVEGTVVIASGYIYYCTANYGGTQYNVQSILPGDGDQSGYLVPNSYQLPQVGWKVYYNGQERTIVQVNDGGNPGYYTVFVDSALQIPANTTFQWGPNSVEDIWKRVAFSNDTW